MRRSTTLILGTVFLASLFLESGTPTRTAEEPAKKSESVKPPRQRMLQGDDAKQVAQQEKKLAQLQEDGQFAEALKVAESLAELRANKQGADHWQAVNAQFEVKAIRRVLKATKDDQKSYSRALATQNEAEALWAKGRYREAQPLLEKVLAVYRKVLSEDHPDTSTSYNWVGLNLNALGKFAEAEEAYRTALAIRLKLLSDEHPGMASIYNNLAGNLTAQGKYQEADEGYRKALVICRNVFGEIHPFTAATYNNAAGNLHSQKKYAEAEKDFRTALAIKLKTWGEEDLDTAQGYNNLAVNLNLQGKSREAEEHFRKALAINRKLLGEEHPYTAKTYNNLAVTLTALGKYQEAEEGCRKALAIFRTMLGEEHPDTAQSYNNVADNLYAQGKYQQAEQYWLQAANVFTKARLQTASTGLERAAFTSEHSPLLRLAAILARNGKPDDAWQRFEESLSRGTWDDLSARIRRPQAERDQQAQITARIDQLNKLIQRTNPAKATPEQKKQREQWLSQLRQAYDELAAFSQQMEKQYGPIAGQVFSRDQIQKSLPADVAFVAWLDIADLPKAVDPRGQHWAILMRSTGPAIWVRLPGSGDKNAWTDADSQLPARLREALQSPHGLWQPLAERLRKQRLDPLAEHLKGVRKLIVLPSTALAGVPLEAITQDHTVSYAHSGTMYAHLRSQTLPNTKGLLVLADPVFDRPTDKAKPQSFQGRDDGNWERLPGARIEAASLQRLVEKEAPIQILLDSDASEERLNDLAQRGELSKYRYIHLATHGEVNDAFPLRSAVILSRDHLPDEKQRTELLLSGQPIPDGRLEAEEALQRWNLQCDLVTLSACQTALGKYESGEGYVGFAQALILCGTRSVCLSLWKVDDTATALLMERFYQNLLGKRPGLDKSMPKAAALAEAKVWLRTLPRQEARARAASVVEGASRAKGAAKLPLLEVPAATTKTKADDCPFAHPYYWAAFVLVGHAD